MAISDEVGIDLRRPLPANEKWSIIVPYQSRLGGVLFRSADWRTPTRRCCRLGRSRYLRRVRWWSAA